MSIFGWKSSQEAELYTKAAERKKLEAMRSRCCVAGKPKGEPGNCRQQILELICGAILKASLSASS
jgi:hypothetical protein